MEKYGKDGTCRGGSQFHIGTCIVSRTWEARIIIPLVLGFAGSYAAAMVIATLLHVGNTLLVTLLLGTVFFLIILLVARQKRQAP